MRALRANLLRPHPGQILRQPVRIISLQFLKLRAAGRHGERLRSNGPGALDIVRRVADDENFFIAQMAAEQQVTPLSGDGGDVVAVFVIVRERAGLENLPKLEVAEFDFRAEPNVAGQQTSRGVDE